MKTFSKILKRIVNTGFITARQEKDCLVFLLKEDLNKTQEAVKELHQKSAQEPNQEYQDAKDFDKNQKASDLELGNWKYEIEQEVPEQQETYPENLGTHQEMFLFSIPVLQIIRTIHGRFMLRHIRMGRFRDIRSPMPGSNRNYRNPVRIRQNIKHYERYLDDS